MSQQKSQIDSRQQPTPALSVEVAATPRPTPRIGRLTQEQMAIVQNETHHLMVEAGAGSGKTTVLTEKILYEMGHGAHPRKGAPLGISEIAAITFTRKAAGEIQERLRQALLRRAAECEGQERERWGERAFLVNEAMIGTIDSFAARILREFGALAGVETAFETLDPADASQLYSEVAERSILEGIESQHKGAVFLVQQFGFLRARSILVSLLERADALEETILRSQNGELSWSRFKFEPTVVDVLLEPRSRDILDFAGWALSRVREVLRTQGVLDHAHVIIYAARLAEHPEVRAAFQERIRLLFVDEHQDTNLSQVRLILRLAGLPDPGERIVKENNESEEEAGEKAGENKGENKSAEAEAPKTRLVLIGDPKQGIYGFRNADITMWRKSWQSLDQCGGLYMGLNTNHRSRPTLLRFFDDCLGRIITNKAPGAERFEVPYRSLKSARPEGEAEGVEMLLAAEGGAENVSEVVAERIAQILRHPDKYPVWERGADGVERPRPARARDIAILSRNLRSSADQYERALGSRGIGCYLYGGRGLYGRPEIQDVSLLLRAVADPHDPFALAAFLRSPMGGVDDHTLMTLSALSTAAPRGKAIGTLYDALLVAEEHISNENRLANVRSALALLERLRSLRDRIPHDRLLEIALQESGYYAYLAGAPDAPAPMRNMDKLIRIARTAANEPLFEFVRKLSARVRRADPEEEAPLYTPDDELVTISTIHKAKGLEWPYVFVVGLDEGILRRVPNTEPLLHSEFGITLPLDIMVRENSAALPVAETSQAWEKSWEDATKREYAEAKRLFYVACTRARDRLFLCGALREKRRVSQMHPAVRWMHKDGVERWLRHLYPVLAQNKSSSPLIRITSSEESAAQYEDLIPVRQGLEEVASLESVSKEEGSLPVLRPWPVVARDVEVHEASLPLAVEEQIRSVEHRTLIKEEFTASELMSFANCPWKHAYGYRGSVSTPMLEIATDDRLVNQILPEVRGDILHDYFREHEQSWSREERVAAMKRALLRHLPMQEESADENVAELIVHAENYLASELYERECNSDVLHREIPYVLRLPSGLRVHGVIDRLFADKDGWHITDFKSGLFRGIKNVDAEIEKRASEYEIQAAIYALGVRAARPELEMRRFTFFFTALGKPYTLETTPEWLDRWEKKIEEIADRVRRGDYGPHPTYEEARCQSCPLFQLCQPKGAPAEAEVA